MPDPRHLIPDGGVAQLGERLLCKQEVIGSIPFTSTSCAALFGGTPGTPGTEFGLGPRRPSLGWRRVASVL